MSVLAARRRYQSKYDGNAARDLRAQAVAVPKREKQSKQNIIKFTEKQIRMARRVSIDYKGAVKKIACISALFIMIIYTIFGQVQMTELTAKINASDKTLAELQAVGVQLEMEAVGMMSEEEIEEYAKTYLGMEKINSNQVTYIDMSEGESGTVHVEESDSFIDAILSFFGF